MIEAQGLGFKMKASDPLFARRIAKSARAMDHRATDDWRRAARAGVSSRRVIPFALVLATCGVFTFPAWESLLQRLGASPESLEAGGRWHRPFSANDLSNLATIRALVEQGTWAIDRSGFQSSDQALIDGRYYSVRPPVLALLASSWR
jgi:hypothetical protein